MSVKKDNSKIAILLDLDGTLLRTGELVDEILRQLDDDLGLAEGRLNSLYEEMWEESRLHGYDPSRFYAKVEASLSEDLFANGSSFQEIFETKAALLVKSFLFDDVIPTLRQLSDKGFRLCIFTKGAIAWQWLKVSHAIGPESFIPEDFWFVTSDKTSRDYLVQIVEKLLESDIEQVLLVDDNERIMREVKENWPLECRFTEPTRFLIRRGFNSIKPESLSDDCRPNFGLSGSTASTCATIAESGNEITTMTEIHSLTELLALLSKSRS